MFENNYVKNNKVNHRSSDDLNAPTNKYFYIENVEIFWEDSIPIGYSFGEARNIYSKEIFNYSFRQKVCSGCGCNQKSDKFYWKVKGFEGPFIKLWGIRQPKCISCEKNSKSIQYKKKAKKLKRVINVIASLRISEVLLTDSEAPAELNRLLFDFVFEVINGEEKH